VPQDAFVVVFVGGYNTWVDEVTLFKVLELAIRRNPKIHYVSTGGAIAGLVKSTFQNFLQLVEQSLVKDHFHFLGWLKTEEIPLVYKEADCGINVDKNCVETWVGARNRINEMLKFGLPVITTLGSEIAGEVQKFELGQAASSGDAQALADSILALAQDPELRVKIKEQIKAYLRQYGTYTYTVKPLLEWLKEPFCAPKATVSVSRGSRIQAVWFYLKQKGIKGFLKKLFKM
jgi:glycosyltransferase involved in cell wall biosynthesis